MRHGLQKPNQPSIKKENKKKVKTVHGEETSSLRFCFRSVPQVQDDAKTHAITIQIFQIALWIHIKHALAATSDSIWHDHHFLLGIGLQLGLRFNPSSYLTMSESLYDIRSNLSSDKITSRAKGRKSCSELINSDANGDIIICNEEWKEILMAALDGALKDTDASLKKDKQPDIEVAVLMRRIVKHTVQSTIHIPFKRYEVLIKHSFQVLYNQAFSAQYRDEYKNILCEILAPKISHSLSFDTFYSIYHT